MTGEESQSSSFPEGSRNRKPPALGMSQEPQRRPGWWEQNEQEPVAGNNPRNRVQVEAGRRGD